jgi:hypothetical protein
MFSAYVISNSCAWRKIAHPTTIARLIGRSVFSGMAPINFLRAEIFHGTFKQTGLRYSSRQFCHCVVVGSMWLAASSGCWPAGHLDVLDHPLQAE